MELCKKARVRKTVLSLVGVVFAAVNIFLVMRSSSLRGDLEYQLVQACIQVDSLEREIYRNGREPALFDYDLFCSIKRGK